MTTRRKSSRKHLFKISIDDGMCEYRYPLVISQDYSIKEIMDKVCRAFKVEKVEGELRPKLTK